MADVYIGLGSNLGDRKGNIKRALRELSSTPVKVIKVSSLIETEPVGGPPQRNFINAAAQIQTELSPGELLKLLKSIERKLGRVPSERNGPRVIDLDILVYDRLAMATPELTIPHPRMTERDFVLKPLQEIAPHAFVVSRSQKKMRRLGRQRPQG